MEIYFATAHSKAEIKAIIDMKPDKLLCSFFYFRNKDLKEFIKMIGYKPNILFDSGAFSALTTGKNISIQDYMNYIKRNIEYIDKYISLDVIGDDELTYIFYKIMIKKGFKPIPVFHYNSNIKYLKKYIKYGNRIIALGGLVPVHDIEAKIKWIGDIVNTYPFIKFHLLGCSAYEILQNTNVYSCDSSAWIIQAYNGKPRHIKGKSEEKKIERAEWNIKNTLDKFNSFKYRENLISLFAETFIFKNKK